jgi:outer membrane immunogenic protein
MKMILLCTAAVVGLAGSAVAADMPMNARPYLPPPVFSWTGLYLGGVLGGVREHVTNTYVAPGGPFGFFPVDIPVIDAGSSNVFNSSRITYGAEAGYNIQLSSLVVGAEFDINYLGFSNTLVNIFALPTAGALPVVSTTQQTANMMLTARGRLGWAVFDRLLVYGTGGVASVHSTLTESNVYTPFAGLRFTDFSSVSAPTTDWVAGGGLEFAVTDHWTIKGEYLHLGKTTRTGSSGTISPFGPVFGNVTYSHIVTNEFDIGRLGLNYKF